MAITNRDDEIYYLTSIMCASIEVIEEITVKGLEKENKRVYDSRIRFIFNLKDRLKDLIKQC